MRILGLTWATVVTIATLAVCCANASSRDTAQREDTNRLLNEIAKRDAIIRGHRAAVASLSPETRRGMLDELSATKVKKCASANGIKSVLRDDEGSCEEITFRSALPDAGTVTQLLQTGVGGEGGETWSAPKDCSGPSGSGTCKNAIDGKTNTHYGPSGSSGRVVFDLGSVRRVSEMEMWKHSQAGSNGIKSFDLESSSDGNSFTKLQTFTSGKVPQYRRNYEKFKLDTAANTRYVAVKFHSNYGNSYTSFWSVKFKSSAPEPDYETTPAPGANVGPHLPGSGTTSWTSLEACIKTAKDNGQEPGKDVRFVQSSKSKCYYYGSGSCGSTRCDAGSQNWRIDPKVATSTSKVATSTSSESSELVDLALNRPATQSSTRSKGGYWPAKNAVDGGFKPDDSGFKSFTMTDYRYTDGKLDNGQDGAWWSVQLATQALVGTVRITVKDNNQEDGFRLSPFRIKVDNEYCTQQGGALDWYSPWPGTGDFTCSTPLQGKKVTIELVGAGRILELSSVEVYSSPGDNPANTTCYDGSRYEFMSACKTCAGPGPSQCTSCDPHLAFVPWRNNATEGACRPFIFKMTTKTEAMRTQRIVNGKQTHLAKWGIEKLHHLVLPAVDSLKKLEVYEFSVTGACYVEKSMHCVKLDVNRTKCDVKKRASLVLEHDLGNQYVLILNMDCRTALVKKVNGILDKYGRTYDSFCYRTGGVDANTGKNYAFPAERLADIADLPKNENGDPNLNEVCAPVLQLW